MKLERQDAAMLIAQVNKTSRLVASAASLGLVGDIEDAFDGCPDFREAAKDIVAYIKEEPDKILYDQLSFLIKTKPLKNFAKTTKDYELKVAVENLVYCMEKLTDLYEELFNEECKDFPSLTPFFAENDLIPLMDRAVAAGLLDEHYQPAQGTKHYHLYLIAQAIGVIKDLPPRKKWCQFEALWNLNKKLSSCHLPITKGNEIFRVSVVYPEVNFLNLFHARNDKQKKFKTHLSVAQAEKLHELLVKAGFLEKRVPKESLLAIMGLVSIPPMPVNWSGSAYSLVYFAKIMFEDLNPSMLRMTVKWFTVDKEKLNYGTVKTKSHILNADRERYDFIPILDNILKKALKEA